MTVHGYFAGSFLSPTHDLRQSLQFLLDSGEDFCEEEISCRDLFSECTIIRQGKTFKLEIRKDLSDYPGIVEEVAIQAAEAAGINPGEIDDYDAFYFGTLKKLLGTQSTFKVGHTISHLYDSLLETDVGLDMVASEYDFLTAPITLDDLLQKLDDIYNKVEEKLAQKSLNLQDRILDWVNEKRGTTYSRKEIHATES